MLRDIRFYMNFPKTLSFLNLHTFFVCSVTFESSFEVVIPFWTVWNLIRLIQAYHKVVIGAQFSQRLRMFGCYTCHINRGFTRHPCCMAEKWKCFRLERTFIPIGKIIFYRAMEHGCRARPLRSVWSVEAQNGKVYSSRFEFYSNCCHAHNGFF